MQAPRGRQRVWPESTADCFPRRPTPRPGHFATTIIPEILRLAFFDSLQKEAGDEFRLVPTVYFAEGPPPAGLPVRFLPKFVAVMNGWISPTMMRKSQHDLLSSGRNQNPRDRATCQAQTGADEHFDPESKHKRMRNRRADHHCGARVYSGW
jgi:hypothetical protein